MECPGSFQSVDLILSLSLLIHSLVSSHCPPQFESFKLVKQAKEGVQ